MGTKSISEFMVGLIAEKFCVEEKRVTDDANFIEDLKADSLDCVELAMDVEDYFGIEIPDLTAEPLRTLKGWVEYLESRDLNSLKAA